MEKNMNRNLLLGFLLICGLNFQPGAAVAQNNPFEVGTVRPEQSVRTVANTEKLEINGSWVNVRSGPGTENDVVKTLPRGSAGTKIAEKNGWSQIDFGAGLIGWVRNDLVTRVTAPSAGAPTTSRVTNNLAAANAAQFERWNRHLGKDLLDYGKIPLVLEAESRRKSISERRLLGGIRACPHFQW
jgi:hypothetical protein